MSDPAARIDLAHEASFAIGRLTVRPSTREVARDDGVVEVLEPRVMQVLVALRRAGGGIVSRDDLTRSCWEGRVVGEDAINRVISRLRRTAAGIGESAFRVETVTKVGYRLVGDHQASADPGASASPARGSASRRTVLGGVAAAGMAVVAGGGLWLSRRPDGGARPGAPSEVGVLMQQVAAALRQGGPEGGAQAIGLLRRVVALRPDYADGWGTLALCYTNAARTQSPHEAGEMTARSRAAATRALALDPANAYARLAEVGLAPQIGNWLAVERVCRDGLARRPDDEALLGSLAAVLGAVGRESDAVAILAHAARVSPPTPGLSYAQVWSLWCAGRLEEADRQMETAFSLFPRNYAVWFSRFYLLMYTDRAEQAIAMVERRDARPLGIPDDNFDLILLAARAVLTRTPADEEVAMRANLAAARKRSGHAENAIVLASALGRIDQGFALLDAYFFDRGYSIGDLRFSTEQGTYTTRRDRHTLMLFQPPMAAMRADPRFARLTAELKLDDYWRRTRTIPDYRRA